MLIGFLLLMAPALYGQNGAGDWPMFNRDLAATRYSPLSQITYAFHFDAALYARYLRGYAEARGVVRHEGRILDVARHAETGFVEAVVLEDGSRIEGDLFVDCSGFRSVLLGQKLGVKLQSYASSLFTDSAIAFQAPHGGKDETKRDE